MLWPLIPKALTIPSQTQLRAANEKLAGEVDRRQRTEESLRKAHDDLDLRVQQRTLELSRANGSLQEEIKRRHDIERALRQEKDQLAQINKVMLDREERILSLKNEVNALCAQMNQPKKYSE